MTNSLEAPAQGLDLDKLEQLCNDMKEKYPTPWLGIGTDGWRLLEFPQVEYSDPSMSYIKMHDDLSVKYYTSVNPDAIIELIERIRQLEVQP